VMGPKQAAQVMHRRAIKDADDPDAELDRLAAEYAEEHLESTIAAREGFVDEIIEPSDTRARLELALAALAPAGRYGNGPGNIPL
jgi:acetyl-CoA/propionyl-CoA carboxylase carboxyl transferase subunit